VDNNLYHFEQHKDEKIGFKWTDTKGLIKMNEITDFNIKITETIKDYQSGRENIPKKLQISSKKNNPTIVLKSKGEQVGYGKNILKDWLIIDKAYCSLIKNQHLMDIEC